MPSKYAYTTLSTYCGGSSLCANKFAYGSITSYDYDVCSGVQIAPPPSTMPPAGGESYFFNNIGLKR